MLSARWVLSAVLSDPFLILSVPVRQWTDTLSEVAHKVWASPLHFKCHCLPRQPNWAKCKWCTCTVCAMAWCMLSRDRVSLFPASLWCLSFRFGFITFFLFFLGLIFSSCPCFLLVSTPAVFLRVYLCARLVLLFTLTFVNNNKPSFCLAVPCSLDRHRPCAGLLLLRSALLMSVSWWSCPRLW